MLDVVSASVRAVLIRFCHRFCDDGAHSRGTYPYFFPVAAVTAAGDGMHVMRRCQLGCPGHMT